MDWAGRDTPSLDDLETLARQAFASLPAEFRALTEGVVFVVEDFPDPSVVQGMRLRSPYALLGLFRGSPLARRIANEGVPAPTTITLYRRPILAYWAAHKDPLEDIVRHVLVHEIGHHFGLSDADMAAIEQAE